MKKEKAKKEKEKYIHVCGKAGVTFVLWLLNEFGGERGCILVDCSTDFALIRYGWKNCPDIEIYQAEKWVTHFFTFEKVVFYHEQQDWYTDAYPGVYFCFTQEDDIGYTNFILGKLTRGRFCLDPKTLLPQLDGGEKIHVLSIYRDCIMGEYYIPGFSPVDDKIQINSFFQILYEGSNLWLP